MATGWSREGLASDSLPSRRIFVILFNTSVGLVMLVIFLVTTSVGLVVLVLVFVILMLWLVVMLFLVRTIVVFRIAAAVYIG